MASSRSSLLTSPRAPLGLHHFGAPRASALPGVAASVPPPQRPLSVRPTLRAGRYPGETGPRCRLAAGNGQKMGLRVRSRTGAAVRNTRLEDRRSRPSGSRGDKHSCVWPRPPLSVRRPNPTARFDRPNSTPARPTGHDREPALRVKSRRQWLQTASAACPFRVETSRWVVNRGCDGASGFSVVRDPRFTWTRRPW